ncbi:gamma carbonic anhydrase family protein [Granulicella cerasi]|uniref:Gamma carbonic anhydrase family protein n=1 Tax=Granulicella cerasi TaxID=741063 RepID=A0ABW1ZBE6_9BACT|nr:gamma carbonic anhydrase family protein [Granulicella cerasi]
MIRTHRGRRPQIAPDAYVDRAATVIGEVRLGARSSVWPNAVLRGDVHFIEVGEESNIQDGAVLHGMKDLHPTVVGKRCTIGHNATVHGCTLEDDVLVGMGAVILNGAKIGAGSIVAAGALVLEGVEVPPASLVAGVPAKIRKALGEEDLAGIRKYAEKYVEYSREYMEDDGFED